MKRFHFNDMKGGWFVGDFTPTALRTQAAEVSFKTHTKEEQWPRHYHAIATEINLMVRGTMRIDKEIFEAGDIFVVEPHEVVAPEFLTDCELVVVKIPGVPNDKYCV